MPTTTPSRWSEVANSVERTQSRCAGTVASVEMPPNWMPLSSGNGCRMTPVLTPECSPRPHATTLFPMVFWGMLRPTPPGPDSPGARSRRVRRSSTAAGSSRRLGSPQARSTAASNPSRESGFSMKSKAPSRVAATAVWMLPWPEIMMTRASGRSRRMRLRSVMPSSSGIHTSRRITSGASAATRSGTSAASGAATTR